LPVGGQDISKKVWHQNAIARAPPIAVSFAAFHVSAAHAPFLRDLSTTGVSRKWVRRDFSHSTVWFWVAV